MIDDYDNNMGYGLQNHCSHEIKRRLLLGRKVMTNLDSIFLFHGDGLDPCLLYNVMNLRP